MPLKAGTRLGPYKIVEPIGKGGMGEVYRARDTMLDRDVAIKVLPEEFAQDDERLARFEREAKLLASLNHPNIASIHGFEESDGVKALVLELVEGPTLAERIEQGPVPVDEAIAIAKQIAEALEAGHESGVIHRDLKPANIKLKEDGTVKVLDYGLAKALEGEVSSGADSELSQSPTLTRQGTQIGVILGTAAYMSPEQAKGKNVDKRTDIFSFGCVLYEMLTGSKTFDGDTTGETLAAVIKTEPEWEALPSDLSPTLHTYLTRSLKKDPKQRVQAIGDVRLALEGAFEAAGTARASITERPGWRPSGAVSGVLAFSVVTGVVVWGIVRSQPTPRPVARFTLSLFGNLQTLTGRHMVALSPDGARIAYTVNDQVYLRTLDQTEATPIRGTEGARTPFFSPDGRWLGFYAGGELKKVAIRGGAPVSICDAINPWGARWGADDTIVFGQRENLMHVSAEGGTCEVLLTAEGSLVNSPQILPGEEDVLFTVDDAGGSQQIVVHSLETGERKVLIEGGSDARYVPTGHLVFVSDGTLFAVPFDLDALDVTGGPVPMVEDVMPVVPSMGAAQFSVSDSGSLVYVSASGPEPERTLVWVDRAGNEETLAAEPGVYRHLRISPDGDRAAVWVDDHESDIWIWNFGRETLTRLTFDPSRDDYPVWTPDGLRVAFRSIRFRGERIYWKAADGTGTAELLSESEKPQVPYAFTPDESQLVFRERGLDQSFDLGVLSLDGAPEPLLAGEFSQWNAELSPDGRWLAYQSNVSGRDEIYARPFPDVEGGRWQISKGGGTRPLWSPDGTELFYLVPGTKLMAVIVQTEPSFLPGNPEVVFEGRYSNGPFGRTYDLSPDGKRFLMIKESEADEDTAPELILVMNWFEELKRPVPANK